MSTSVAISGTTAIVIAVGASVGGAATAIGVAYKIITDRRRRSQGRPQRDGVELGELRQRVAGVEVDRGQGGGTQGGNSSSQGGDRAAGERGTDVAHGPSGGDDSQNNQDGGGDGAPDNSNG